MTHVLFSVAFRKADSTSCTSAFLAAFFDAASRYLKRAKKFINPEASRLLRAGTMD
jgi:hypothetical protein